MLYPRLLWAQLFVALVVAALHLIALHFSLYYRFFWFDVITHFLGGALIALLAAWILARFRFHVSIPACILVAIYVGVAWEIFEYVFNIPQTYWISYPLDTVKDVAMDTLGGTAGAFCAYYLMQSGTMKGSYGKTAENNPS